MTYHHDILSWHITMTYHHDIPRRKMTTPGFEHVTCLQSEQNTTIPSMWHPDPRTSYVIITPTYVMVICHGDMSWWYVMVICHTHMSWFLISQLSLWLDFHKARSTITLKLQLWGGCSYRILSFGRQTFEFPDIFVVHLFSVEKTRKILWKWWPEIR